MGALVTFMYVIIPFMWRVYWDFRAVRVSYGMIHHKDETQTTAATDCCLITSKSCKIFHLQSFNIYILSILIFQTNTLCNQK